MPTGTSTGARRGDVVVDSAVATDSTGESIDPTYIAPIEVVGDADGGYYIMGSVIARFVPGASAARVAAAHGASVKRAMLLPRAFLLSVPAGAERAVARALSRNPNVEFAERDYLMAVTPCEVGSCTAPSDPYMGYKWDLHNSGTIASTTGGFVSATGAADADIDWLEAFDYLGPDFAGAAKIGIVDTGIYPSHPDLLGKVVAAQNFATGYPSTLIADRVSHGTHVAGIAAARGHNGAGVTGVGYGANIRLINAKACELYLFPDGTTNASCPTSASANAIVWATDQGANVLNLSLGGPASATSGSALQRAALQYARARNVLPFCASGNENYPGIAFPARFPECVAVGATSWSDTRASYSNHGAKLELAAPGGDGNPAQTGFSLILSTDTATAFPNYAYKGGTSMATPQVAGLAALLYATGMTNASAVLARIEATVDDLGPAGRDDEFGYGRINVYRAITQRSANAPPDAAAIEPYAADEGSVISFDGSASVDPNGKPLAYAWDFGDGTGGTGARPTHAYADNGDYTGSLTVTDQSGLTATKTTSATIANVAPTGTFATSAAGGRVVVGTPVALSFTEVTDPSTRDAAVGITRAYSCVAEGEAFTTAAECATPNVGTIAVRGILTDKDGAATTYGPTTITVEQAATAVTVENAVGQYSDELTISASLSTDAGPGVSSSPTGTMEFFVDGVSVGTRSVAGTGAVTITLGPLAQPASSHAIAARFTSTDANYASSALSAAATLTIGAEAAALSYATSNVVAKRVASPGGTAEAFELVVSVREARPDEPTRAAGAAAPGDIDLAPIRMVLSPVGPGGAVSGDCAASQAADGYATKTYTCSFAAGVPVNTYAVQVSVVATSAGAYYAGTTEDVLTVYDPSLGYATGGGSFAWPGSGERTTFGFTIKYTKSGSNSQGSLFVVRRRADGTTYRLKSNALDGLALSPTTSGAGWATFSGKATYIEPGWALGKGNVGFTAYVVDNGADMDAFWLETSAGMSMATPATDNAQPLTDGSISVPHGAQ